MSRLGELIRTLCPNGVEYKRLGDCLDYEQPTKYIVHSNEYENVGLPVLTAGQTFILGYTSETDGIFEASKEKPVIIFDDFTTSFHWVDFNFKVKSSAMKMLRPSSADISFRFVYYAMRCIKYETLEHSRQWISKYSDIEIPVPPMEVQEEIVRILDKFTALEAELEAELEARKKQYEHYRDTLLDFAPPVDEKTLIFKRLGDVCDMIRGVRVTKRDLIPNGKYPVVSGGTGYMGYINDYNREATTITIAQYGTAGYVKWQEQKFWANDVCFSVLPNEEIVVNRYLYYVLSNKQEYLYSISNREAVPYSIDRERILNIEIPLPPIEEQERIVGILNKFEALCTDLCDGLPAEIEARRRQYEHYRDKLLSFKRI